MTANKNQAMPEPRKTLLIAVGISVWVSFLSAGVATVLFFSAFDPSVISEVATFPMTLDRSSGYSIGFLLFWALLFANSLIAILLSRRPLTP